jgi:tRNA pseudouridine32 synthase/23S rRNA pseudouridine746 synthase
MPFDPIGRAGPLPPLQVLHIDDSLVVVNKPPGLLSVPGRGAAGQSHLLGRVVALAPDALVVHRLDMATSGLIVFARGAGMQRRLSMAFAARQVDKGYVAVVEGEVTGQCGTIDRPLAADWPNRPRQIVDPLNGKPALTHWTVLARHGDSTRLALAPLTGRSHQLRVHLQSIGHPIRGDELYASLPLRSDRLLLHARHLAFEHPRTQQRLTFTSEAPF